MEKYEFSILTRDGQKVDSLVISAADQIAAERKLRQIYRHCEIVTCTPVQASIRTESPSRVLGGLHHSEKTPQAASLEDILTLISK